MKFKKNYRWNFFIIVFFTFFSFQLQAVDYDGAILAKITIKNNETPDKVIKSLLKFEEGDPLNKNLIRQSFRDLYQSSQFKDISFDLIPWIEDSEKFELIITVQELQKIKSVKIVGNTKYQEELPEEIPLVVGRYYTKNLVNETILYIKNKYQEDGYLTTEVTISKKETVDNKQLNVEIEILEGSEMLVGKIQFHGNSNFSKKWHLSSLKNEIETKEDKLFSEGVFNEATFEEDQEKIIGFYKKNGYINASIDKIEKSYIWRNPKKKKKRDLLIDIYLTEGDKYFFGEIKIKGNRLFSEKELKRILKRKKGDVFNQQIQDFDIANISQAYHGKGYIFSRVTPIPTINEDKTIDHVIDIYEGDKAHVERIFIEGNEKTERRVIAREILIKEGEIFNSFKIRRTIERLMQTQYFKNVLPEPRIGSVEGLMNLVFKVEEQQTGIITAGAGFGTTSGFTINAEIRENNLAGKGVGIGAKLNIGSRQQFVDFNISDRWLFGRPIFGRVSLLFNLADRQNFLKSFTNTIVENVNGTTSTNTTIERYALGTAGRHHFNNDTNSIVFKTFSGSLGFDLGYRFRNFVNITGGLAYRLDIQFYDSVIRYGSSAEPFRKVETQLETFQKYSHLVLPVEINPIHTLTWRFISERDSRNNFINPTRGSRVKFENSLVVNPAQAFGGAGLTYTRWNFHLAFHLPLVWKFTLSLSTDLKTLGNGIGVRNNRLTTFSDFGLNEHYRFFKEELRGWNPNGDIDSHRRQLAARGVYKSGTTSRTKFDENNYLVEGNALAQSRLYNSVELYFPIAEQVIWGGAFVDAGNMSPYMLLNPIQLDDPNTILFLYNPLYWMYSFGAGIRLALPQFPIRLYLAYRFVPKLNSRGTLDTSSWPLELYNHRSEGSLPLPEVVFTIAGFF